MFSLWNGHDLTLSSLQLNDLQAKLTTLDSRREPFRGMRLRIAVRTYQVRGQTAEYRKSPDRHQGAFWRTWWFSLKIANLSRLAIRRDVLLNQFRFELQTWLGWNPASMESANCD